MSVEILAHSGEFHILDAVMLASIVLLPGVAIAAALVIGSRMIPKDDDARDASAYDEDDEG